MPAVQLVSPGFPIIFYRFKQEAYSKEFAQLNLQKEGLYYGGVITYDSLNLYISPFLAVLPNQAISNFSLTLQYNELKAIIRTRVPIQYSLSSLFTNLNLQTFTLHTLYIYILYTYDYDVSVSNTYTLVIDTSPNTLNSGSANTVYISKFNVIFNNNKEIIYFKELEKTYGSFYSHDNFNYFVHTLHNFDVKATFFKINGEKIALGAYSGSKVESSELREFEDFLNILEASPPSSYFKVSNNGRAICSDNVLIFNFEFLQNVYLLAKSVYSFPPPPNNYFGIFNNVRDVQGNNVYVDYILSNFDSLDGILKDKNVFYLDLNGILQNIFLNDSLKISLFMEAFNKLRPNFNNYRKVLYKKALVSSQSCFVVNNLLSKFEYTKVNNKVVCSKIYTYNY